MKALITYLFMIPLLGIAQLSGFEKGNKAYAEEDYASAVEAYEIVIAEGHLSSELFYNAGNAYYRNEDIGKAIWAYEKALKIKPTHKHAKENLEFTNLQTVDKLDNSAPGIGSWLQGMLFGTSINLWAYISIVASVLFALSLTIFFRSKKRRGRNLSLMLGAVSGFLLLVTVITSHQHKLFLSERDEGVIISDQVEVKISPIEKASVSFKLHAGSKVKLVGSNDGWLHVEVNDNSGWIEKSAVWEI